MAAPPSIKTMAEFFILFPMSSICCNQTNLSITKEFSPRWIFQMTDCLNCERFDRGHTRRRRIWVWDRGRAVDVRDDDSQFSFFVQWMKLSNNHNEPLRRDSPSCRTVLNGEVLKKVRCLSTNATGVCRKLRGNLVMRSSTPQIDASAKFVEGRVSLAMSTLVDSNFSSLGLCFAFASPRALWHCLP